MQTKTQCKRAIVPFIITILVLSCISMTCGRQSAQYWPPDGATLLNRSWDVPLPDSSSVLQKEDNIWILPIPPDTAVETTQTRHLSAKQATSDIFGRVDQIVVHDGGIIMTEYYRFCRDGVYALGYSHDDSGNMHTRYEPPLLFLPNDFDVKATQIYETRPALYDANADSEHFEQKMRISLTLRERGFVRYNDEKLPALWVKMRLSQDATVRYGSNDLLLNDAMMMQSDILLIEDIGPVMEWGVRSKNIEQPGNAPSMPVSDSYVRITLHQAI